MKSLRKKIGLSSGKSKIRNAKKHIYDGIEFDSGLEVTCYKELKANNIEFNYNQYSFILIENFKSTLTEYIFNLKGILIERTCKPKLPISYTPDFVGSNWIIETKGFANDSFPMRWKLFVRYLSYLVHNPYKYLFIAGNRKQIVQCIEIIKTL